MKKLILASVAATSLLLGVEAAAGDRHGNSGGWYNPRGWQHHGNRHGNYNWHGNNWHGSHGWHSSRPRTSFSLSIGVPAYWPRSYHSTVPYWYTRPTVVVQQPAVTYVQREAPPPQPAQPAGYWYYCPDSQSYYPYAQTCPSDWLQVVPQTVPQ